METTTVDEDVAEVQRLSDQIATCFANKRLDVCVIACFDAALRAMRMTPVGSRLSKSELLEELKNTLQRIVDIEMQESLS